MSVKAEAPLLHFVPCHLTATDRKQLVSMLLHSHRNDSGLQCCDTGMEKPDEMHGMFPFDLAAVSHILPELLEL